MFIIYTQEGLKTQQRITKTKTKYKKNVKRLKIFYFKIHVDVVCGVCGVYIIIINDSKYKQVIQVDVTIMKFYHIRIAINRY